MDQPFIYKYKPNNLDEFLIDDSLIELIKNLSEINNLNILLVGNYGCGKTTLIECIIKYYYGENYNKDNVLIINSLKDQGISYYRYEVKTFCQTISTIKNKKKIIVLDDLDNINEQSQQVFRNCIDKYSDNVHFITSCKNLQKVINSLQSRILILKINQVDNKNLEFILNKISKRENISITPDAKDFIISISNSCIRILINYLEKFKLLNDEISLSIVYDLCTNISYNDLIYFTNLCKNSSNLDVAIDYIYKMHSRGYSVMDILDTYFTFIKYTDIVEEEKKYIIFKLLCKYISIFYTVHEDEIELILFTNSLIKILSN